MRNLIHPWRPITLGMVLAMQLPFAIAVRCENPPADATTDSAGAINEEAGKLIAQLGAQEFNQRRQAFLQLWRMGQPAVQSISAAKSSSDRSVADAAMMLNILIELKIAPQHMEETSRLLEVVSHPTPAAVVELCGMGYWSIANRMLLENSELSQKFQDSYGRYLLSRVVDIALEQRDATLAWPIVRQLASAHQAAWIAHKTGLELGREDPFSRAQQLYFKGDIDAALMIDLPTVARVPMLTRTARWKQLLDPKVVGILAGTQESPSQQAAIAVLHEVAGDYATAASIWDRLLLSKDSNDERNSKEEKDDEDSDDEASDDEASDDEASDDEASDPPGAAVETDTDTDEDSQVRRAVELLAEAEQGGPGGRTNKYQLMAALLFTGRVAAIEQMLVAQDPLEAFNFFMAGNQHTRAFETLGLAEDLTNFDPWLAQRQQLLVKELSDRGTDSRQFDQCVRLCSALSGLGYRQQTQQLLDVLVEVARLVPARQAELWSRSLLLWLGRSEARQMALNAAKSEFPQMSEECQTVVLKGLFPEFDEVAGAIWNTAPGDSDELKWKHVESLYVFDRSLLGSDVESKLSAWLQRALDSLSKEVLTAEQLMSLAQIALGYGESNLAIELLENDLSPGMGQSTSPNLQWAMAAKIMTQRGTPEAGLQWFQAVRQSGSNPQQTYVDEVHALLLSGHFELARALERSRWLRPLATTRFFQGYNYLQAARELFEDHQTEQAAAYAEAAFLLSDLGSMDVYWGASEYAEILEKLENPSRRADVLRAAWVESLQPYANSMQYMFSNGYTSSLRYSAQKEKLARAIVCIEADDIAAFQHQVAVARRLQSQDIEVVCQCYPLLLKAGRSKEALELFNIYEADMQQQLKQWPNDATALNNLAWMYSQCDLKLDEALQLSQRAIQLAPSSAVFLDTLAEIQFRCDAIEDATQTMRQCIRLDPREVHYRENLVRFQQHGTTSP